ncbi:hypothetical protein COT48_00130 [Candidatus Woesearchaeota archaeon CG08_land_8_20_14_0_20_47_9]|nr:MAG: hypothetical protein COT48_00130 [Candidatus Woesearchaeota archaeon CG08_land_8_20_14_0_20_47_9]
MGRTHALALAGQGAKVVITDIDLAECELVADEVRTTGGDVACFKMDVSSKDDVDNVFDKVIAKYGRLDILVNNAAKCACCYVLMADAYSPYCRPPL